MSEIRILQQLLTVVRTEVNSSVMVAVPRFDLGAYLSEKFPSLSLDGGLFHRWPLSVRFELGMEALQRASELYERVFSASDRCVVISQDWPENTISAVATTRYYPVFLLPGAFDQAGFGTPQRFEQTDSEGGHSVLEWVQLPARSFSYVTVLEGIANADRARTPSVSSRVYFLNPTTHVLLHMYDDRGLDIIAAAKQPILPISREFQSWVQNSTCN